MLNESKNKLMIEATDLTPKFHFDASEGVFAITGKSLPDSGELFYKPILDWLETKLPSSSQKIKFHISLDQMNLSSSKMILFILYKLKAAKETGKIVSVWWYHASEDSDMLEVGEDYEFMVDIPFRFKVGKFEASELLVA